MLTSLPPRERQIVDVLYELGASSVNEIGEALHDEVSGSAIRAMLQRLERKGFVERKQGERGFLYSPAVPERVARKSALSQVVKVFFNGSPGSAAAALLGMQDELNENELDELERLIADARQGRKP
ncbi:BlaI/MecI/CopY family transcriptional regulator [Altererythrobacter sp. SALINAS58]|uniref:BlaI/MecI/CopY family transcriptional regulator n=1 Tax=Alteripontixanthobacter muriae TaxID=2705546 RepID=UPI0015768C92|nr:BlaI/MecI/CopY family transcriptional regulator [Alteripontixanthobacter muriae]NTZ43234.1 BlaI/MecI/CopY family transcriptional regulator [Alteripontixanthobacter muriae]